MRTAEEALFKQITIQTMRNLLFNSNVLDDFSKIVSRAIGEVQSFSEPRDYQLYSNDGGWVLQIDAAGLERSDIEIDYEEGELRVSSEHSEYGFAKTFGVGKDVDLEKVSAKLADGVLEFTLPKTVSNKKQIEIL